MKLKRGYLLSMMKRLKQLLVILSLPIGYLRAQTSNTDQLLTSFESYSKQHLPEKLFIHTDKTFYLAGEICWFKIYAVDGAMHQPLNLSKVVYVEILDSKNKPVLQTMADMQNASGSGSFLLPNSLSGDNYTFRAYTNRMKNSDPEYYFQKQICIVNSFKNPQWKIADTPAKSRIQFFPEGGNLISGFENVMAFKIVDSKGKATDANGVIVDQDNNVISHFSTQKFGMGKCNFTPGAAKYYKAIVTTTHADTLIAALPEVLEQGWLMHVESSDPDTIKITVRTNLKSDGERIFILSHTRLLGKQILAAKIENGVAAFVIDKHKLYDGISQFTLFDPQLRPVCERLFFNRPKDKLPISITSNKTSMLKRSKAEIDIESKAAQPNLSVSVFLTDELQSMETEDIRSYLWLRSDLKGNIENANYYFDDSSSIAMEAADNLMLTQGWRRFTWQEVFKLPHTAPTFLAETDGHLVSGTIIHKITGRPVQNIPASITMTGYPFTFKTAISNSSGQLLMDIPLPVGHNEMIVQSMSAQDSTLLINITNPFSDRYSATIQTERFDLAKLMEEALTKRSIGIQVQQLYNADKLNQFYGNTTDSTNFYGNRAVSYLLDDYTRFQTLEEVLREYVREVRLRKSKDQFHLEIKNNNETDFTTAPLVLLDGMPVFNIDKLLALDPLKLRKIDVVQQQYIYGQLHVDGIISLSSYHADLAAYTLEPNALLLEYPGAQFQREFYSPSYDNNEEKASRIPDFRSTLYWDPSIKVDENGKAHVSFYTSDQPGNYAIVVQGIAANGKAGCTIQYLTVH